MFMHLVVQKIILYNPYKGPFALLRIFCLFVLIGILSFYVHVVKIKLSMFSFVNSAENIYVRRKVRIGTIPELSCAKWE